MYYLRFPEPKTEILAYFFPRDIAETYPQQSEALCHSDFYVTLSP